METIEPPVVRADEVLVEVHASSINPADLYLIQGIPYMSRAASGLRAPRTCVRGQDIAGVVAELGSDVTAVGVGDEVYAESPRGGGYGERAAVKCEHVCPKPARLSFEQAATVPVAGVTALQGLRDIGRVQAGHHILINGASGGVGTFAVQIARALGAHVTGVCSSENIELVRSFGADRALDYHAEDFTTIGVRFDLIFDLVGNRTISDLRRALTPEGSLVLAAGGGGRWLGPVPRLLRGLATSPFTRQRLVALIAKPNAADLRAVAHLIQAGDLTPVLQRTVELRDLPNALDQQLAGHAKGKVAVRVQP